MSPYLRSIVVAAALCGAATAASAQMSYEIMQTPEENNYLSQRYDWLLETNFAFRQYRMRKECSPIDDMALHGDCIASFDTFEPWRGL
jgi:hypothetical protein